MLTPDGLVDSRVNQVLSQFFAETAKGIFFKESTKYQIRKVERLERAKKKNQNYTKRQLRVKTSLYRSAEYGINIHVQRSFQPNLRSMYRTFSNVRCIWYPFSIRVGT